MTRDRKLHRPSARAGSRIWTCLRRSRIELIALALVISLAAACGLWGNRPDPRWIGLHRDEVIQRLGEPAGSVPLPDGGQRWTFIQFVTRRPSGSQVAGATISCRLVLETDANGIVIEAERQGC